MPDERVVVTGLGAVSPLGLTAEASWQGVLAGRSGIAPITLFDASVLPSRIAGEVHGFDPLATLQRKDAKRLDRFAQLAVAAAAQAVDEARLSPGAEDRDRIGVMIGSGIGGIETLEMQMFGVFERGVDRLSPFFVPMMICDMASGAVSIHLGFGGPNSCVVTACATGTNAIGDAAAVIRRGDAAVMLAGGAEAAITRMSVGGFCAMRALSTRNEEPQQASRPFDRDRDGFVIAEGAAVLILESLTHARARGARILAEVVGYGMSADAYHMTQPAPGGAGAARAMAAALRAGGLVPEQVDYINAHGTSTPPNDRCETQAIKTVFGEHAYRVPISSTKSMTGHMLGAAGAIEAMFCVQAIRDGKIPPTINRCTPDPDCDLDYVTEGPRPLAVKVAMSNSFGFGGHNATIVLRALEDQG
jgi:3-oxoacyl-[acyl-carrier-protein] synthase II